MIDQDNPQQEAMALGTTTAVTLWPHLKMMLGALRASRERFALYWLGFALVVIISATAYGQIRLNAWNKPFYDALSRKELSAVIEQLWVFAYIAGALLVLNVAQTWLAQTAKLKLREGMTRDLFFQWLKSHRSFRIASLGEIGVNPDQRIHADAQRLAEVSTDLGIGLLQATLLLLSFVGVLWDSPKALHSAYSTERSSFRAIWCGVRSSMQASLLSPAGVSGARWSSSAPNAMRANPKCVLR